MLKIVISLSLFIALIVLVVSCSGGRMLSAVSLSGAACSQKNIVFDPQTGLKLDVYYAPGSKACDAGAESKPETVIFVYGGSWKDGDKSQYGFVADAFTQSGFNVVMLNYRLFPEAAYPEFIDDIEKAVEWFVRKHSEFHLDANRVHWVAHSAGAYNVAMYLCDNRYQKPLPFTSFVGLAGPYDFFLPSTNPKYKPIFERNKASFNSETELPVHQKDSAVGNYLKRALLVHGADDTVVTPKNLERFSLFLRQHSIQVNTKLYDGKGHVAMVAGINNVPMMQSAVKEDVLRFLQD